MKDKLKSYNNSLDYSIRTYTDEQKNAIDVLVDFISDDKSIVDYTVEGPGGTGKTTIVKDVLKFAKVGGKRAISAPTHKAVRVISKVSGMKGATIHKLLGLRPNVDLEDFNPNSPKFSASGNSTMGEYTIVVIDEASMINHYLYDRIIATARRTETKIIFLGDECQTAPVSKGKGVVKEIVSKVFTTERKISLTRVMRQGEDNPLIGRLNTLRTDVKLGSSYFLTELRKYPKLVGETGGYFKQDNDEFIDSMNSYFTDPDFVKNVDHVRTACYTNAAVSHWNSYVRRKLFPDVKEILCKDDFLMSYSTIAEQAGRDKIIEIMFNSEDYIIHDFNKYVSDQGLKGYLISLQAVSDGTITPFMFVVDHTDVDSITKYMDILIHYISTATRARNAVDRRIAWQEYYKYRNKNLVMIDLFYADNKTLLTSKDLDYGFALTVHKTQGSTYNNIFVDGNNIIYNKFGAPVKDIKARNKLLYVALSRPTTNAFININI